MANLNSDIRVFEDLEQLSRAAAAAFVEACVNATSAGGRFTVALSGGGTPAGLYGLLARAPFREQVNWGDVQVFWGDERCVPADDPENNYRQAYDSFLGRVPIPAENMHRVRSELQPELAAADYAAILKQHAAPSLDWPRFDLVLLGMGDDGHTASLFPGSPVEASRAVLAVEGHYQDRPAWRVSLTPLVINAAKTVIFLVSGDAKAVTLANVLYGEHRPASLPAQRIRPTDGSLIWMLDRAAAAALPATLGKE